MSYVAPEKIIAAHQASIEALMTIVSTTLASTERLAALNLEIARSLVADTADHAKTVLSAKDAQQFAEIQKGFGKPVAERVISYSRNLYEITSQTKDELHKVFDGQYEKIKSQMDASLQNVKSATAGSDIAISAVQSVISAADSAYARMNSIAKQMSDISDAVVTTSTQTKSSGTRASAKKVA